MSDLHWLNDRRRVSSLIRWTINPRTITETQLAQLRASLERFNLADPIIIDTDNTVVGGHQRLTVLQLLGRADDEIDVRIPSRKLSDDEFRELALRLNANGGDWDWSVLGEHFDADFLHDIGFEAHDLVEHDLMEDPDVVVDLTVEAEPRVSEVETLKESWQTARGQLWALGRHRLLCGDATSKDDVGRLLDGAVPFIMITDPPYGVNYDPAWREERGLAPSSLGAVPNDDRADWREAWALFPGDVAYVWHAALFTSTVQASLEAAGFDLRSQIVWCKPHFAIGRGHYHWQHEPCWYAVRHGRSANWHGDRDLSTVWSISLRDQDTNTDHSTQKPIECMQIPMRQHTQRSDGVYDPFCGSGTSIIAAQRLGRTCYAMEIDPGYVAVILQRYADATGERPLLLEEAP